MDWTSGVSFLFADDVKSYSLIAETAPSLPKLSGSALLSYHHGSRFVFPFLAGAVAKTGSIDTFAVLRVVSYGFLFGTLVLLWTALGHLGRDERVRTLLCLLYLLSPYGLRYYLIVPGLVPDTAFLFFSTWFMHALIRSLHSPANKRVGLEIVMSLVLAGLARQTAWTLLPGLVFFGGWLSWSVRGAAALGVGVAHFFTGWIAKDFSLPSSNLSHMMGVFSDLASFSGSILKIVPVLFEHSLRVVLPVVFFFGFAFVHRKSVSWKSVLGRREAIVFLLMTAGVLAQPFLAGWEITGRNGSRLGALALPLALGTVGYLASTFRTRTGKCPDLPSFPNLWVALAALMLASLHPLYSRWSLGSMHFFVLVQILVGLLFFTAPRLRFERKRPERDRLAV